MHGVGYPGAARDRQAIDIDRFQGHGQFFFPCRHGHGEWWRNVGRAAAVACILCCEIANVSNTCTHTEREKEWSLLTFPIIFPTHSLTHSITPPTHISSHLCSTSYSANSHVSKVKKTKKNLRIKSAEVHDLHACLRGRLVGWVGVSLLHLRHPVSSQSQVSRTCIHLCT